jgi:hypothetical protein
MVSLRTMLMGSSPRRPVEILFSGPAVLFLVGKFGVKRREWACLSLPGVMMVYVL